MAAASATPPAHLAVLDSKLLTKAIEDVLRWTTALAPKPPTKQADDLLK